jgi:hypothetical protein
MLIVILPATGGLGTGRVTLAPLNRFAGVVPAWAARFRRLDRLAIDHAH